MLSNNRWRERWCQLRDNQLLLHKDRTDLKSHIAALPLRGCEVIPGLDSKHPFAFRLLRNGQEVAVLEVSGMKKGWRDGGMSEREGKDWRWKCERWVKLEMGVPSERERDGIGGVREMWGGNQ